MNNRNVILFVIGSMILLGGQFWLSSRYAPAAKVEAQAPPRPKVAAPPPPPAAPSLVAVSTPGVEGGKPADPAATHTLASGELTLTWNVATGALKQVVWRKDGTPFFPDGFLGLGALKGAGFQTVREEPGTNFTAVIFENTAGERLSYLVPQRGHTLKVEAVSPKAGLHLIVNPPTDESVKHLGRVFTLTEKGVEAVTWTEMLSDPFFSFVGAKRKILPPSAERLGLDAGLEKNSKDQRNHYFAALWKLPRLAARDEASGYHLLPENGRLEATLYLGPKQAEPLLAFEKPFTQVIDYGFFGAVSQLLFWVLKKVHALVGNWGWAIVIFTVIIRVVTWHLNTKQTISMLRMKDFEPHQQALQAKYDKFGGDMTKKAEMQKELMELYKKNGHNPMGGCFPMLLQMPIFLALWSMLNAVFELRQAPFFGWITDLSARDPYFIYPVLMGVSMFAQQYMTPAVGDPAQRKMMLVLMPAMMTFFFAQSSAGLVIYYFVFNMIGLIQTWWVMRSYQPQPITL